MRRNFSYPAVARILNADRDQLLPPLLESISPKCFRHLPSAPSELSRRMTRVAFPSPGQVLLPSAVSPILILIGLRSFLACASPVEIVWLRPSIAARDLARSLLDHFRCDGSYSFLSASDLSRLSLIHNSIPAFVSALPGWHLMSKKALRVSTERFSCRADEYANRQPQQSPHRPGISPAACTRTRPH
jgi:hypothetical protein